MCIFVHVHVTNYVQLYGPALQRRFTYTISYTYKSQPCSVHAYAVPYLSYSSNSTHAHNPQVIILAYTSLTFQTSLPSALPYSNSKTHRDCYKKTQTQDTRAPLVMILGCSSEPNHADPPEEQTGAVKQREHRDQRKRPGSSEGEPIAEIEQRGCDTTKQD